MQKSQLDAKPYGMGELITQRKLLMVPEHQRSFSWTSEEVEQFLDDIKDSFQKNAVDYFIGVIVLQGPIDNIWIILDGQQRLATTTMIYSAIREWLHSRNFKDDAQQIENEFIGVRQLGGQYNPRITLNSENMGAFDKYVIQNSAIEEIYEEIKNIPKKSSNRNLLESVKTCRDWFLNFCTEYSSDREEQAKNLFNFSSYIEKRVKVVCVDVTSEADAYILFESLNDRGVDLSALDLVKNHIFKLGQPENVNLLRHHWELIKSNIEGKDADDFLKVFWTSRFGIIQKVDLFRKFRSAYADNESIVKLVKELSDTSEKLKAIDDPQHELWAQYGDVARFRMTKLNILGSKQVRPVILSALSRFKEEEVADLLWKLIVLIVRYQLIGRERTGVLEKTLGKIAESIWSGVLTTSNECYNSFKAILPDDESFYNKFCKHTESKPSRVSYLLSEIEGVLVYNEKNDGLISSEIVHESLQKASADFILKPVECEESDQYYLLGNRALLEYPLLRKSIKLDINQKKANIYCQSNYISTKSMCDLEDDIDLGTIRNRTDIFARIALEAWNANSELQVSANVK